jgi:hypothetical protein
LTSFGSRPRPARSATKEGLKDVAEAEALPVATRVISASSLIVTKDFISVSYQLEALVRVF